jgi:hypothetical protein
MIMMTVTAWSLGAATILNSPTPQSTTPPCHAYPLNAGDECRRCMDDACDNFQKDWGLCHGNSLCQATVRLLYELALDTCVACVAEFGPWAVIVAQIPELGTPWATETVAGFALADLR